ncbi:MAG TPA: hypothetical protein VKD72_35230 [Gemmataceae bacterium]|nr:hypothetical protein [Gemmataceae bacterium]
MATKNSAPVHKNSARTASNRRVKPKLKRKPKKQRRALAFMSASLAVASRLTVISIGGMLPTAPAPRPRPCSIIGVHGYAPTDVVRCNLYGGNSSAPTTINGTVANFRWQVDIGMTTVPVGEYLVEIVVLDNTGALEESTAFGLSLM